MTFREALADPRRMRLAITGRLTELPAPADSLRLRVEAFGPPSGDQRSLLAEPAAIRRARLREAVRQTRAAAGPDAALRILAVDPDSRVPERRLALAAMGAVTEGGARCHRRSNKRDTPPGRGDDARSVGIPRAAHRPARHARCHGSGGPAAPGGDAALHAAGCRPPVGRVDRAPGPRRLAKPKAVRVKADDTGRPQTIEKREVDAVRESWLVEDRWWTDAPLRRRYWEVVTGDGRDLVVFRDLIEGRWYAQR